MMLFTILLTCGMIFIMLSMFFAFHKNTEKLAFPSMFIGLFIVLLSFIDFTVTRGADYIDVQPAVVAGIKQGAVQVYICDDQYVTEVRQSRLDEQVEIKMGDIGCVVTKYNVSRITKEAYSSYTRYYPFEIGSEEFNTAFEGYEIRYPEE